QRAAAIYERIAGAAPGNNFARAEVAYANMYVSAALAQAGKGAQALALGERSRALAEEASVASPTDAELRGLLASTCSMLGDIHVRLAAGERQPGRQADHWRAARDDYQRSYAILKAMKDRGEYKSVEYGEPEEAAAKIAQCDAALAKLNAWAGEKP